MLWWGIIAVPRWSLGGASRHKLSTQVTHVCDFCQERNNDKPYIFGKITIRPIDRIQNEAVLTHTVSKPAYICTRANRSILPSNRVARARNILYWFSNSYRCMISLVNLLTRSDACAARRGRDVVAQLQS